MRRADKPGSIAAVSPGIDMRLFWCKDETGKDQIIVVVSEQGYFELEKQAQKRGKTVAEDIYPRMIDQLEAHGFNTPLDCFFVTTDVPCAGFAGALSVDAPSTLH